MESGSCVSIDQPVVCGWNQCQYDNQCWADSAGFAAEECTLVASGTSGGPVSAAVSTCMAAAAAAAVLVL